MAASYAGNLVLVSTQPEDIAFADFLAFANNWKPYRLSAVGEARSLLPRLAPNAVLFDADMLTAQIEELSAALLTSVAPSRVVVISNQALNTYPALFTFPAFGHHWFRRFDPTSSAIFAKLLAAMCESHPFGIQRFFPEKHSRQRIVLKRSGHKNPAVEALQKHLMRQGISGRLSALVSQALDELIMNAIFDAPVLPNGTPLRRGTERSLDFELIEREHVEIELVTANDYAAVSVSDQFGSLRREKLFEFLKRDFHGKDYVPDSSKGAGLGLLGTLQSGLSLLMVSQPKVRTEATLFFHKTENYKAFREGFRFFGVVGE